MKVHEIMTAHARCVGPENTLVEAAGLMRELDVGALPVCEDERPVGMVTDRDITLRGTAEGKDPNTTLVQDVMTPSVVHVFADQDVEQAVRVMEERQIRRLPVLSRDERLVGIVSLGDIAISSNPAFSGMALRDVSEPRQPTARQRRLAERSRLAPVPLHPVGGRSPAGARRARGTSSRQTPARGAGRGSTGGRKGSSRRTGRKSPGRTRRTTARAAK